MQDAALTSRCDCTSSGTRSTSRHTATWALAQTEEEKQAIAPMDALRPLLKHQLAEARKGDTRDAADAGGGLA